MSEFSAISRGLKDLFPASRVPAGTPGTLSDDVQLTAPMFGPLHAFENITSEIITSVVSVGTVSTSDTPSERVRWVIRAQGAHDDTTSRRMEFNLARSSPAIDISALNLEPGLTWALGVPAGDSISLGGLLIPAGFHLNLSLNALTAGKFVQIRWAFIELTLADVTPSGQP